MFRNVEIGLRPHLQQQAVAFVGGPEQVDVDVAALTMRRNGVVPAQPQPLQQEQSDAVFGEDRRHLRGLFLLAAVAFLLPFGRQGPAEPKLTRRPQLFGQTLHAVSDHRAYALIGRHAEDVVPFPC